MSDEVIKVLVVDDSSVVRKLLKESLSQYHDIEVIATAPDPIVAAEKVKKEKPDVITLDVEMPRMDGISFLNKMMKSNPLPTIIVSSLTSKGSDLMLKALSAGAFAVVPKPVVNMKEKLKDSVEEIVHHIRAAVRANIRVLASNEIDLSGGHTPVKELGKMTNQICAIASSTGGTKALEYILTNIPPDFPGTIIVQHMPPVYTNTFAVRLNEIAPVEIKEAEDGERMRDGLILIAPGDYHAEVMRDGAYYRIALNRNLPVNRFRPSGDVLFNSVARAAGQNATGLILTGMGKDGAAGMKAMHDAGAYCFAQDEVSSVVFGMPKEAIKLGAVDKVVHLMNIPGALSGHFKALRA